MSRQLRDTQPVPVVSSADELAAHDAAIPTSERPTRDFLMRRADDPARYNTDGKSTRAVTQVISIMELDP